MFSIIHRTFLFLTILAAFSMPQGFTQDKGIRNCDLDKMRWNGIPFDHKSNLHPECRPQVLYSWLTSPDVINQDDYKWPLRRGRAWLFRTPLGSSLYGSFSFRVKLKPDVKFKLHVWDAAYAACSHNESEKKDTIYMSANPLTGFSEYMICNDEVIESWSYAMPEHLAEMKREKALVKELGNKNVDGFLNANFGSCPSCFLGYTIHDARNDGSEATLDNSIRLMEQWVQDKKGKVFSMSKGQAFTSGEEVDAHFHTLLVLPFHKNSNYKPKPNFANIKMLSSSANDKDVLDKVSAFCDGKASCKYKISDRFLKAGIPIESFTPKWTCCDLNSDKCMDQPHSIELKGDDGDDLEGNVIDFGCDVNGAAVTSDLSLVVLAHPSVVVAPVVGPVVGAVKVKTIVRIIEAKANDGDVTTLVSDFCENKDTCEYQVKRKFLKTKKDIKSLKVRWSCVDTVTLKEVVLTQNTIINSGNKDLEKTKFELSCDDSGNPKFKWISGGGVSGADSAYQD